MFDPADASMLGLLLQRPEVCPRVVKAKLHFLFYSAFCCHQV